MPDPEADSLPRTPDAARPLPVGAAARRVLVIDDSPFAVASVRKALEGSGWGVRTSGDSRQARQVAEEFAPHVVVCDLHMPDLDGVGVIGALADLLPPPPVIVMSGDDDLAAVLHAIRAGAFDYVVKSSGSWDTLHAAVDRAHRHFVLLQENRSLSRELAARLAELEVARDQAVAGSRAKSAFLANMSHELRTPLNAILGYAELMSEEMKESGDPRVSDVDRIRSAGRHLLALIDGVLDLAKIEAGHTRVDLAEAHVADLIDGVAATIQPLAARRNNRVIVERPDLTLVTDELKLRQCLLNLIGNASKFTENGTIALRATVDADEVRFVVTDSGIGMTPEQTRRVFDAFEQADGSTTRRYGGTGLGLTITRRLVELLGGTIAVVSVVGAGSTFTIRLPRRSEVRG